MKSIPANRLFLATVLFIPAACSNVEEKHSLRLLRNLQSPSVTKLELINAQSDKKIMDLFDGAAINIQDIVGLTEPDFNINALTTGSVSSVKFGFNGNENFNTERSAPYAFCGNNGSNFYKCTQLTFGNHSVTAVPIFNGTMGPTLSMNFTIVSGPIFNPVNPPVPLPSAAPQAVPVTTTKTPTKVPSETPTKTPTQAPTKAPLATTTKAPTKTPTKSPTKAPSKNPTKIPTKAPTKAPIETPTTVPTIALTKVPAKAPTATPLSAATPTSALQAIHTLRLMYTGVSPSVPVIDLIFDTVNVVDLKILNLPSGKFNIDALVGPGVKSVTFSNGRTETSAPLAYCGNSGNNFYDCDNLVDGANVTVTVTAFPEGGGLGSPILTRSTIIHLIRPLPPVAPTPPTAAPVQAPVIPPVAGCPVPKLLGKWEGASSGSTVPYPIQVAEAQGAMIGNDFIITSGFNGGYSTATPETYALDMSAPSAPWRRMDDMPFPLGLTHLGVAVKGMKAFFCGGYVGGSLGIHNGSCFQYDHSITPGNGQWTNISSIPDGGRSGGGMIYDTTLDAIVYSAGSQRPRKGSKSAIDFRNTWMYSLKNPEAGWVPKADIPFTGNHMNFVTAKDETGKERHYFFGGQRGDNEETGNTDEMYEYNAVSDVWTKRQSIPYPLGHAAATARAIGCGFIVAGGRLNTGLTSAITYYDIPTNSWTKIGDLTHKIHTNVCVIANGLLRCETGWATGTFSWKRSIAL